MDNRKESLVLVRLKTQAKTIASTKAIPEYLTKANRTYLKVYMARTKAS